jgi:protein-tyrosine-phosphatase
MPDSQKEKAPRNIVFVCSGNICRSPAAEALARLWLDEHGMNDVSTSSCGTLKINGDPAAPFTVKAMAERGADLDKFRSRGMSYFLLREIDLIICLEQHHRFAVIDELGGDIEFVSNGVYVLTEFHPEERYRDDGGIYDFVSAPWDEYREGIKELDACIKHMLEFYFS